MQDIRKEVQLNIPFRMLLDSYLDRFIEKGFNPEIGFDAQALDEHPLDDFKRVSERLRAHDLKITFHFPFLDLSPGSPEPAIRELTLHRFRQVLPLIPLFRPRVAVCHTGYDARRYGFLRESWLQRSVAFWSEIGSVLKEEGCLLVLENVYEQGPQEMARTAGPPPRDRGRILSRHGASGGVQQGFPAGVGQGFVSRHPSPAPS